MRFARSLRWVCFTLGLVLPASGSSKVEAPRCGQPRPFWHRVTNSAEQRYCRILDSARAKLWTRPEAALELGKKAAALSESATEARVLQAHAHQLLGNSKQANEIFTAAAPDLSDSRISALLRVSDVLGGARAALLSRDYSAALLRYRWVLLRLPQLRHSREEARALIEAATAAVYASPKNGREARAYLAGATRKNSPLLRPIAQAAWVLSHQRDGQRKRAQTRSRHFKDSWSVLWTFDRGKSPVGRRGELLPVLPLGEQFAMAEAIAIHVEPKAATLHRQRFEDEAGDSLPEHLTRK